MNAGTEEANPEKTIEGVLVREVIDAINLYGSSGSEAGLWTVSKKLSDYLHGDERPTYGKEWQPLKTLPEKGYFFLLMEGGGSRYVIEAQVKCDPPEDIYEPVGEGLYRRITSQRPPYVPEVHDYFVVAWSPKMHPPMDDDSVIPEGGLSWDEFNDFIASRPHPATGRPKPSAPATPNPYTADKGD